MSDRRGLLILAAGAVSLLAFAPAFRRLATPPLAYEPIPDLPGFRRLKDQASALSRAGGALLLGRDGPAADIDPCNGLFRAPATGGAVPMAYFTDARCGYCRQLSPILADLAQNAPVDIAWHEWPRLGEASVLAARAALAARAQGGYGAVHKRLMGTPFVPTDAYLRQMATEEGLDPDRLIRDMDSPAVAAQLARTEALAQRFGFLGTPALVIGRTVHMGLTGKALLNRLIAAEQADPAPMPCG